MAKTPLVYILTPSYNCGHLINRLLDSVLEQTYPNIEMTVIDDGSTDNTKEVIERYQPLFLGKGYKLNYIYQNNSGQSAAINNGLKLVHGDYLSWPDADDWYSSPDAISISVASLESSSEEVTMLRTSQHIINENGEKVDTYYHRQYDDHKEQFLDCLFHRRYFYNPGGYMVKTSYLDEVIPKREIFTYRPAGQNLQLMLPFLWKGSCISLQTALFNVYVRTESHSHSAKTLFKLLRQEYTYHYSRIGTVRRMKQIIIYKRLLYEFLLHLDFIKSILILTKGALIIHMRNSFKRH